jgi:MOSC domain-containing protein
MTAGAGVLAGLHRYPVKRMMGKEASSAESTRAGLFGDRAYALCDAETGKVVSAKNLRKWPNLFSRRAAYTAPPASGSAVPPVRVTLPDDVWAVSSSGPSPLCVMTTLAQGELPKYPAILKTAGQYNGVPVRVYASVIAIGTILVGDTVTVI